jgi:hypothetical protein
MSGPGARPKPLASALLDAVLAVDATAGHNLGRSWQVASAVPSTLAQEQRQHQRRQRPAEQVQ